MQPPPSCRKKQTTLTFAQLSANFPGRRRTENAARIPGESRTHARTHSRTQGERAAPELSKPRVYLLPVLLQGRQGREVSGVVHDLELLEDAAHGDDIHFTAGMQPRRRGEVSSSESEASPRRSHRSFSLGRTCMYEAFWRSGCARPLEGLERVTHRERTTSELSEKSAHCKLPPDSKLQTSPPPCDYATFRRGDQ